MHRLENYKRANNVKKWILAQLKDKRQKSKAEIVRHRKIAVKKCDINNKPRSSLLLLSSPAGCLPRGRVSTKTKGRR